MNCLKPARFSLVLPALVLLAACTSNPFGDGDINGGNRNINGRVHLQGFDDASEAVVWLEGLGLISRTDRNGDFTLSLPAASILGDGHGLFDLYFYVANFNVEKQPLTIRNGAFVYSDDVVSSKGEFRRPIFLGQNLSVAVDVTPTTIPNAEAQQIAVRVLLSAPRDSVDVFFPFEAGPYRAPLIFRNLRTGGLTIKNSQLAGFELRDQLTIDSDPYLRTFVTGVDAEELPVGKYQVIPFLFVRNPDVPAALFEGIGEDIESIGPDYLKIPFKWEGGIIEVLEARGDDDDVGN